MDLDILPLIFLVVVVGWLTGRVVHRRREAKARVLVERFNTAELMANNKAREERWAQEDLHNFQIEKITENARLRAKFRRPSCRP